ncbi:OLC1v1028940C5 [Oldenlandia corymbosa var. corymbosa]|uniref:OLC1v1028940C5 n=1 Tax=Oldenlandia corymbosa var. corymbosa TaxID=529605 RepID=A0AAV1CE89_OLDCO|nr:OLC1v1028940C5 [Oldenlandia corymbosa var. corymbosa]
MNLLNYMRFVALPLFSSFQCLLFYLFHFILRVDSLVTFLEQHISKDWISQLPNEVICCILSFLSLKEAGRTSVLSERWKHLWKYVPALDFNAISALCKAVTREEYVISLKRERCKFVNWVNQVLEFHQTLDLNKFRVYTDLDDSFGADITKWLQYAFDKRVERLEVSLSQHGPGFLPAFGNCVFPSPCLGHRFWNSLKVLILKRVLISGADLEFFLHNCKFLESLVVHCSSYLSTLEVCGPTIALQHLEICFCPLKKLIVCDAYNLISLSVGVPKVLVLDNVPRLVHIHITNVRYNVEDLFHRLWCCFSELEVLSLALNIEKTREYEGKLPQPHALKQLLIELYLYQGESTFGLLVCLDSFFRASPNLEKFVAKVLVRYIFIFFLNKSNCS